MMCDLVAANMTAILIQVRNRRSGSLAPAAWRAARRAVYRSIDAFAEQILSPNVDYTQELPQLEKRQEAVQYSDYPQLLAASCYRVRSDGKVIVLMRTAQLHRRVLYSLLPVRNWRNC